ncbi:MAG: hypothetical protein ACFB4I_10730 [Cyanophyceae cyanobacterium]
MISRDQLVKEYVSIVNNYHPIAGHLLRHCLVKVIGFRAESLHRNHYYLGIYYPNKIGDRLLEQQDIFKGIAENMGLVEVVFLNANHLVRDPLSKIKQQDFRFWLELSWIANS